MANQITHQRGHTTCDRSVDDRQQVIEIELHHAAPAKPVEGSPCNGCGLCCALTPCPLARLRFWRWHGRCPALRWLDEEGCYRCGLLIDARQNGHKGWAMLKARLIRRWIGAGHGCDCSAVEAE